MYTTKSLIRGLVTLALVTALSGYAVAAGEDSGRMTDQPSAMQQSERQMSSPTSGLTIRRTSQLIGEPLKNAQGETLGTIYDLVLTEEHDQVSYVALSRGGLFGIGRSLYAIPWSTLELGAAGSYIAPVTTQELSKWRGFNTSQWPDDPHRDWATGTARTDEERQTAQDRRSVQNRRVSRIIGSMVKTPEDRDAGNIQNLVVAMDSGKILYTIVSFGGFFGLGEQYAAVPQSAIDLQPDQRVAQLSVSRDVLQENSFAAGQFPDLGDATYARNLSQSYGTQPEADWVVLGFIPAEEPDREPVTTPQGTRPETRTTPGAPAPDATRRAPTTEDPRGLRIDPQAKFDPAAVTTIEGVVTMVGKSMRTDSGPSILLLRVRTDAGEMYTVHAGPLDYVSKQDFYAVSGDRVSVTGSPTRGDRPVFLAARISKEGQILTLRNREGRPLWERSSGSGERPNTTTHTPGQHMEGSSQGGASERTPETP